MCEKIILICNDCRTEIDNDDRYEVDNIILCQNCYDESYTRCEQCDNEIPIDESIFHDDMCLCDSCYTRHYFRCEHCNSVEHLNERYLFNGYNYCTNCYDELVDRCGDCGNDYSSIYDACPNCESENGIHDYSYKPRPEYKSKRYTNKYDGQIYLGVELEHQFGDLSAHEITDKSYDTFGDFVYYKHDSTVSDGAELVTHPSTIDEFPFSKFKEYLKWLSVNKCRSWSADCSCGLHVHISKDPYLFDKNSKEQKTFLTKLALFMSKFESTWFKVSGRRKSSYDEYCKIPAMELDKIRDYSDTLLSYGTNNHIEQFFSHYSGVNYSNIHTIEFRIFRGTLDYQSFSACVKLPFYICNFVKERGLNYFTSNSGIQFDDFKNYVPKELQKFINKRLGLTPLKNDLYPHSLYSSAEYDLMIEA